MIRETCAALAVLLLAAAPVPAQHGESTPVAANPPPLYTDLGSWSHKIRTASPEAQKYFDQGLRLAYGFNHDEAARAFREASRLDPRCPMAWWGVALVAGPNINWPMDEPHRLIANEAIARAQEMKARASATERDYIDALATRYSLDAKASRAGLDSAYANSMRGLVQRLPSDPDAAALCAEALLDLNPWNQWTLDEQPNPGTLEIVALLEATLKKWPDHPGANHYYIHTVEASADPGRALPSCQRLETLVPGAGHLVHMPSHIYARTGRWADAVTLNQRAAAVDEKYIAEQKPQGVYPLMYYNHNLQFIWFASSMEGRCADALAAARKITGNVPPEFVGQMPMIQHIPPLPALTLAHFGRWDEVLKEPAPPVAWRYSTAMWCYARGLAQAAKGDFPGAAAALDTIRAVAATTPPDFIISINQAQPLLQIAAHSLAGAIAARRQQADAAVLAFRQAVATEDSLHYDEPPTWYYPVREELGAVLLDAGRAAEAEAVYREDLRRHPENGWSLCGLGKAMRAQGRTDEATALETRFQKAWARADVKLTASAF